jgi:hypothetical protein
MVLNKDQRNVILAFVVAGSRMAVGELWGSSVSSDATPLELVLSLTWYQGSPRCARATLR